VGDVLHSVRERIAAKFDEFCRRLYTPQEELQATAGQRVRLGRHRDEPGGARA
jgi:hypothetical protein